MENATSSHPRIDWLDKARAYGMFLVFYGHFVETVSRGDNAAALLQQKFVYAFHMPLFILISGFLARSQLPRLVAFLKARAASRLLPVLFFSVLMMPVGPLWNSLFSSPHRGPSRMRARYIDNWADLCNRLHPSDVEKQSPPQEKLWKALPAPVQKEIIAGATAPDLDEKTRDRIVDGINSALIDPHLYAAEDFADGALAEDLRAQFQQDRTGREERDVQRFNLQLTWRALYPEFDVRGSRQSYWSRWKSDAWKTLRGYTEFNVPIWFLICLFTVEFIHFLMARLLTSPIRIGLAIPLFFTVGWFATVDVELWSDVWYIRESLFLYSFYLLGYLLRRTEILERIPSQWFSAALLIVGTAALLFTFDLNPGSKIFTPVVLINLSQHGDPFYFTVTVLAGCLATIGLARLTPNFNFISATGRNSLIFMGLNGFFFDYGNRQLARLVEIPPSHLPLLFWCTFFTLATMAACVPFVSLFNRYVPQLIGRPRESGPLLPPLV
jgi:fucose 4-O-acetylase-like acetyltransferase